MQHCWKSHGSNIVTYKPTHQPSPAVRVHVTIDIETTVYTSRVDTIHTRWVTNVLHILTVSWITEIATATRCYCLKKTKSTVTIKNYQAHYIHIASIVLRSTSHLAVSWKLLQPQAVNKTDPTNKPTKTNTMFKVQIKFH